MEIDYKNPDEVLAWNRKLYEKNDFMFQVRKYAFEHGLTMEDAYQAIESLHVKLTGARKYTCFDSFKKADYRHRKKK